MEPRDKVAAYYEKENPFKTGITTLRKLALQTKAVETYKWRLPVYTIAGKNVFGICRFKAFFGVWFFNGALLKDKKKVLRNAQEGKTKAMRHWNFTHKEAIDEKEVLAYMQEAIKNQEEGNIVPIAKNKALTTFKIPVELETRLQQDSQLQKRFQSYTHYKQKEFCEFITAAKLEATRQRRLDKIIPLIQKGIGLNDKYR